MQSNTLSSRIMAMVSEDSSVKTILDILLGPDGAQLEVRKANAVVSDDEQLSFWQLAVVLSAQEVVLVGYIEPQQLGHGKPKCYINPVGKGEQRSWAGHSLVVMTNERSAASNRARLFRDTSSVAGYPGGSGGGGSDLSGQRTPEAAGQPVARGRR